MVEDRAGYFEILYGTRGTSGPFYGLHDAIFRGAQTLMGLESCRYVYIREMVRNGNDFEYRTVATLTRRPYCGEVIASNETCEICLS